MEIRMNEHSIEIHRDSTINLIKIAVLIDSG